MLELLFLLLPVVATYSWYMGRNSVKQREHLNQQALSEKYSTGLNYLLSNQQDKAIDFLLEALNVEEDSVEAHFAMANLFRRRGELDRALKIHEHLVRHANLPRQEKYHAIFELAKDFLSAGLFDRAETMFNKLLKSKNYRELSLHYLLQIYQSTKDWQHGLSLEKEILKTKNTQLLHKLANFYCEKAVTTNDISTKIALLDKALTCDANSCRANVMLAEIYREQQQYDKAIACYQSIYQQDKEFFPDVIEPMKQCFIQLNQQSAFFDYIKHVYEETASASALICYVEMLAEQQGNITAQQFMVSALKRRPTIRGFKHFVKIQLSQSEQSQQQLDLIRELISAYLKMRPRYSCRTCGFNSNTHYWACPSCHDWEQLKPVRGLEGE
jgi:lipopolysaccharide biosynthesis regulator YciM